MSVCLSVCQLSCSVFHLILVGNIGEYFGDSNFQHKCFLNHYSHYPNQEVFEEEEEEMIVDKSEKFNKKEYGGRGQQTLRNDLDDNFIVRFPPVNTVYK